MDGHRILPGVPAMWYGNPSAVCFIGAVMRLMEYIGDPVEQDELMALSGVGLCFPWQFASPCDEVGILPEIPAHTFEVLGYESAYLNGEAMGGGGRWIDEIKRSIDRGRPVIGFGITVDMPMACLIAGYDAGGLYVRAFWPPEGERPDSEDYFYVPGWRERCSGLLILGEKTGERLTGAAAYACVSEWALKFRCHAPSVNVQGQEIFINQHAFDAMEEWLLDDEQWKAPNEGGKEQYLKQCGLLLFQFYRSNLYEYLKKLDGQYPGVVSQPAFAALERILQAIPGAQASDLWLHEAVDPALREFSAMSDRSVRQKVAAYVRRLKEFDNSVQWTLFMPDFVKNQTKGFRVERFEYCTLPAMRLIGVEGEVFDDAGRRAEAMRALDAMQEYASGFDYDLLFMHHNGLSVDHPWHGVWGRFMKAGAPVPEGFLAIDFVPCGAPEAGPPYHSRFAFAVFSGGMAEMHAREGFDSDAMYDVTRNIILGDGVSIPYPEKYWTAEVFLDGFGACSTGYLFSVGEWPLSE